MTGSEAIGSPRLVTVTPKGGGGPSTTGKADMLTRMSEFFVRTLREDPADAEVPSHRWLVRAGYIRRTAPGIYTWLPLGLRVLRRIEAIAREEMAAIGSRRSTRSPNGSQV